MDQGGSDISHEDLPPGQDSPESPTTEKNSDQQEDSNTETDQHIASNADLGINGRINEPVVFGDADSDDDSYEDVDDDDSGQETDVEDNIDIVPYPGTYVRRVANPQLPDTVTLLETDDGCKVYVVGTAHFSKNSQDDVAEAINVTQPDVVMVELCSSRVGILQMDEKKLLEEAKNINFEKFRSLIKQTGVVQGIVHVLLLNMSAHLTQQLGMAPGGEFRRAFLAAQNIPGCRIQLGDRPVGITLRRAVKSLSWWQKAQLMWCLLTSKEPISKEEVEKCKQRDLLEEMMREMAGEFPALSQVFVKERDLYLAHSLRMAAKPVPDINNPPGTIPSVVVGVVGMGHVQGIVDNWDTPIDVSTLLQVPPGSGAGRIFKWALRAALVGLISWGCLKVYKHLALPQLDVL